MSSHKEGVSLEALTGNEKKRKEMYLALAFKGGEVGLKLREEILQSRVDSRVLMNVEVRRIWCTSRSCCKVKRNSKPKLWTLRC
jgi:hypothetical protein